MQDKNLKFENCTFVISRFNEEESSFSWVKGLKNYIIYNKGNPNELSKEILSHTINKENYGKDVECIFSYIIDNYNNLPEIVAFIQAEIKPHYYYPSSAQFLKAVSTIGKSGISEGLKNNIHHAPPRHLNFSYFNLKEWPSGNLIENYKPEYTLSKWWQDNSGEEYVPSSRIFFGCIFGVSKHLILRRPREFYIKLREPLLQYKNPIETHFVERAWPNIFKIESFN